MSEKIKVLFIGNSHTYYNDMAYILKYFSIESGVSKTIDPVTLVHPGKTLGEHKGEPEVRFNILFGEYDYIVLQQAAHPFPGEDELLRDAKEINEFIKGTSSTPILYMTWAEKAHPENQEVMTEAYLKLAREIKALVAPAGLAFQKLIKNAPQVELYDKDGGHASFAGSYLVACLFYSVIYRKNPEGLPNQILHKGKLLGEIDKDTAKLLQETAWETIGELNLA